MIEKKKISDFKEKEEDFSSEHNELVTNMVSPYLERITEDNQREYNKEFYNLPGHKRILIDSLIIKALLHDEPGAFETEAVKPKEIAENKSLNVNLELAKKVFNRELKKFFKKSSEGYVIPNVRIKKIKEEFFRDG